MDLRKIGEPFEKFVHFNKEHIEKITKTYHDWQKKKSEYKNIAEYCYSTVN